MYPPDADVNTIDRARNGFGWRTLLTCRYEFRSVALSLFSTQVLGPIVLQRPLA
jgi:hypothetical protein